VALWHSNQLHFHVNEKVFRRVVAWVVLFGGLSLFFAEHKADYNDFPLILPAYARPPVLLRDSFSARPQ